MHSHAPDRPYVAKVTYYDPRGWDYNRVGYGYSDDESEAIARALEGVTAREPDPVD